MSRRGVIREPSGDTDHHSIHWTRSATRKRSATHSLSPPPKYRCKKRFRFTPEETRITYEFAKALPKGEPIRQTLDLTKLVAQLGWKNIDKASTTQEKEASYGLMLKLLCKIRKEMAKVHRNNDEAEHTSVLTRAVLSSSTNTPSTSSLNESVRSSSRGAQSDDEISNNESIDVISSASSIAQPPTSIRHSTPETTSSTVFPPTSSGFELAMPDDMNIPVGTTSRSSMLITTVRDERPLGTTVSSDYSNDDFGSTHDSNQPPGWNSDGCHPSSKVDHIDDVERPYRLDTPLRANGYFNMEDWINMNDSAAESTNASRPGEPLQSTSSSRSNRMVPERALEFSSPLFASSSGNPTNSFTEQRLDSSEDWFGPSLLQSTVSDMNALAPESWDPNMAFASPPAYAAGTANPNLAFASPPTYAAGTAVHVPTQISSTPRLSDLFYSANTSSNDGPLLSLYPSPSPMAANTDASNTMEAGMSMGSSYSLLSGPYAMTESLEPSYFTSSDSAFFQAQQPDFADFATSTGAGGSTGMNVYAGEVTAPSAGLPFSPSHEWSPFGGSSPFPASILPSQTVDTQYATFYGST